ncbi:alpha-amylase [Dyadobacter frigoris]|uniref:alpha-amylase n=1 Tax=Dyadobacter frigoris TaxID=2576211 RepID=UPI00404342AC
MAGCSGSENGNYDYLMLSDIDFRNPFVKEELKRWGEWFYETVGVDGFRLDAIRHMDPEFYNEWLDHLRGKYQKEFYTVGEYWVPYDLQSILTYIEATNQRMSLFDAPLQGNFYKASKENSDFNLCTIFDDTLVQSYPQLAVTLVGNHDTQPLQSLEQTVEAWFRPLAYALILFRKDGYPCIFYTDLYGTKYKDTGNDGEEHEITLEKIDKLEVFLYVRKHLSYSQQNEYFNHPNCIGWTREGDDEHKGSGCAVIISNGEEGTKTMSVGAKHAGKKFVDYLGNVSDEIVIGEDGSATFKVSGRSVSLWGLKNN